MTRKTLAACTALTLGLAGALSAQAGARQFHVGPRAGNIQYEEVSGLKSSGILGFEANYFLTRNLAIGMLIDASRPQTDGKFFPAELSFRDTTMIFEVSMPVTVVNAQVQGVLQYELGRIAPFVTGGVGVYKLYLDPQVATLPTTITNLSLSLAGGLNLRTGSSSAVRLEIRDHIYTDFDREQLNPVDPRYRLNEGRLSTAPPARFPERIPPPPASKSTLHNLTLLVGFSFMPAAAF
jgi:hypothetical protein